MYERLLIWMLKPALAIFSMVASCKLPFGRPNFSFLLIRPLSEILLRARPRIFLVRFLHARRGVYFPSPARQRQLFLFLFHGLKPSSRSRAALAPKFPHARRLQRISDTTHVPRRECVGAAT